MLDKKAITKKLNALHGSPYISIQNWRNLDLSHFRDAAVLIPILRYEDSYRILFTKRSEQLRQHSGEVSFPGGRRDEEDVSLLGTALRESAEEIGLSPDDVKIHGKFCVLPTISKYNLTAFVGELEGPYVFEKNEDEIETIFEVSLLALSDPKIYSRRDSQWEGQNFPMHEFRVENQIIWGATGYILFEFLKYLGIKT